MIWHQVYDPLGSPLLSTLCAALPVIFLLGALGFFHMRAHLAALLGLLISLVVAIAVFGMPGKMAGAAAGFGGIYGLTQIGWIILNIIFLYRMTVNKGLFKVVQDSISSITTDRRLQLLLITFCFGAFFEGAAGFGVPVAVTGAILIGLGFSPLAASGLSLIANTAPVAFAALGVPVIGLQSVSGLDLGTLTTMVARLCFVFCMIVPFWLIWTFAGFRRMLEVWPAIVVAGVTFAVPQLLIATYMGPQLVNVLSAIISVASLLVLFKFWHPKDLMLSTSRQAQVPALAASGAAPAPAAAMVLDASSARPQYSRERVLRAWLPWLILTVVIFIWGLPDVKTALDHLLVSKFSIPGLDKLILRSAPIADHPKPETAVLALNWLSATGSGILVAALISGLVMGYSPLGMLKEYGRTLVTVRYSLLTIAAMMALGFVTRYAGTDATMGLMFARTGALYPFFGTLLGWLGVALTGSDTSSNVMFGSLQRLTAQQVGLNPNLMVAANSAGGIMGKMIDAQSIVVASTATEWFGHEGDILRYVFWHSLALGCLVGVEVFLFAYVEPFSAWVLH